MFATKKNTMKREHIRIKKMTGSFETTPGLHFEGPNHHEASESINPKNQKARATELPKSRFAVN
jgi:hypothetical protein